jgi:hypothetical protein
MESVTRLESRSSIYPSKEYIVSKIPEINVPRVTNIILELQSIAQQRKECLDRLWLLEDQGERKRQELMCLLA